MTPYQRLRELHITKATRNPRHGQHMIFCTHADCGLIDVIPWDETGPDGAWDKALESMAWHHQSYSPAAPR